MREGMWTRRNEGVFRGICVERAVGRAVPTTCGLLLAEIKRVGGMVLRSEAAPENRASG
jgi:hypothetical protein